MIAMVSSSNSWSGEPSHCVKRSLMTLALPTRVQLLAIEGADVGPHRTQRCLTATMSRNQTRRLLPQ